VVDNRSSNEHIESHDDSRRLKFSRIFLKLVIDSELLQQSNTDEVHGKFIKFLGDFLRSFRLFE